jgi:hypothetical protein
MFDTGSMTMQQRDSVRLARPAGAVARLEKRFRKAPYNNLSAKAHSLLDTTAMIRSLQRSEGEEDCYRRGREICDRRECPWRRYCLTP